MHRTVALRLGARASVVDDRGDAPAPESVKRDALVVMSDAAAMTRALGCCFANGGCSGGTVPGFWSPIGPNGGCIGGALTVTVDLGAV